MRVVGRAAGDARKVGVPNCERWGGSVRQGSLWKLFLGPGQQPSSCPKTSPAPAPVLPLPPTREPLKGHERGSA